MATILLVIVLLAMIFGAVNQIMIADIERKWRCYDYYRREYGKMDHDE